MSGAKLFLRLDLASTVRLGPGKIRLLEEIARHGSISAAGRAMKMSYRRAWLLVDDLNSYFRAPAVTTRLGGVDYLQQRKSDQAASFCRARRQRRRSTSVRASRSPICPATGAPVSTCLAKVELASR